MKHLLATLLIATICAATSHGQTIKSLGYNASNNVVVFAPTNTNAPLTMTNDLFFESGKLLRFSNATTGPYIGVLGGPNILNINNGNSTAIEVLTNGVRFSGPISFVGSVGFVWEGQTRTNLGLPLAALTNTSNVTAMRALSGSTNTNHPFSGSVSVVGTNNTNTLVFSNGILQSVQ